VLIFFVPNGINLLLFVDNILVDILQNKEETYMKWFDNTSLTLVIIGALNWLLIGVFRFDLVAYLFGNMTLLSRIVYILVGLCGLYLITLYGRISDRRE